MKRPVQIKHQLLLLFGFFGLFIIGSLLLFYHYSGRASIRQRADGEIEQKTRQFQQFMARERDISQAELTSLRSRLITQSNRGFEGGETDRAIRDFLVLHPSKYSAIFVLDTLRQKGRVLRMVRELGSWGVETQHLSPGAGLFRCFPRSLDSLYFAPVMPGPYGLIARVFIPLNSGYVLAGELQVNTILEHVSRQLALTEDHTLAVADSSGHIFFSETRYLVKHHLDEWEESAHICRRVRRLNTWNLQVLLLEDITRLQQAWQRGANRYLFFSLILLLFTMGLIWLIGQRLSRSLARVAGVAREVARGDFTQKLDPRRRDELGLLFEAFNEMTDQLQTSYSALNRVNRQLEEKIDELVRTRQELSKKERLALVGETVSRISHEIQNRVGSVSIWVQNLQRTLSGDKTALIYLEEMKSALNGFMDLLIHFKRFYREPQLNKSWIAGRALAEAALLRVKSQLESKAIQAEIVSRNPDLTLLADEEQMIDALVNLLINAIYVTPEKGRLSLETGQMESEYSLAVLDEGPGIPLDVLTRLGQPFFTTKSSGSGLGLAIVSNIARAHGGCLIYENRKSGGAKFEIRLPMEG